jgi:hypothetical protein
MKDRKKIKDQIKLLIQVISEYEEDAKELMVKIVYSDLIISLKNLRRKLNVDTLRY